MKVLKQVLLNSPPPYESINTEQAPPGYLTDVEVAFIEASPALAAALRLGLPNNAAIRSLSPGLVLGNHHSVQSMPLTANGMLVGSMLDDMYQMTLSLFKAFAAEPSLNRYAATASFSAFVFCNRYATKAAMLSEADFNEPRAVVLVETGQQLQDETLNPPWPELLAKNPQLKVLRVRCEHQDPGMEHPGLLGRMLFSPFNRVYRVARLLSDRVPSLFRGGDAYVIVENDLLRETAVKLALRGYRIHRLPPPSTQPAAVPEAAAAKVDNLVDSIAGPLFKAWTPPSACAQLNHLFAAKLCEEIAAQDAAEAAWNELLGALPRKRPAMLLTNYPKGTYGPALTHASRNHHLPFVAFQHGLGREFGSLHYLGHPGYESVCAEHVVVYNEESVRITDAIPFGIGKAIAAGLSSDLRRTGRYRPRRRGAPPLLYVSTNLYTGFNLMPTGTLTDADRARQELALLENVLQQLPHRVTFKPHIDDNRYWDTNPVMERSRQMPNIEAYARRQDLRYILPDARVVITSRATSTLGPCMMSGKPLVYLDYPDQLPLKPEVRPAFEMGLFLFDGREEDFLQKLRDFLSQPLIEIERQWRQKAASRQALIDTYFDPRNHINVAKKLAGIASSIYDATH